MTAHEFDLPVSELDAGGKDYRFVLRHAWLLGALEGSDAQPAADAGAEPGEVVVRASKSGEDVIVQGTVRASLIAPCARCLAPASIAIFQHLTGLFSPKTAGVAARPADYEFGADEADVMPYEGDVVVLDDLVRDELLLEIPMIPLCSEDCPGIRPPPSFEESAAVHAVDPRLAPLLQIKPSRNPKE